MSGCGCNNAVKIEPRVVGKPKKKTTTTKCLNYGGYNNNNITLFKNLSLNYTPIDKYQYYRIVPNYFRFCVPSSPFLFDPYEEAIGQNDEQGRCLRAQLQAGPIRLWSLEEMFIKLVPSSSDLPLLIDFKNIIRNQWLAFCLNIEKTFLDFEKGKLTCNNNIVPWVAYFNITTDKNMEYGYLQANEVPITNYDQTIMYKLANNFNVNFIIKKKSNPFNYYNILRKALSLPLVGPETQINFYELIFSSYILLQELFSISQTLLLGKDPGLPKEFIDLYFPPSYQRYYYNYYLSWVETRNRLLGFGDRINASNGSGTYIKIPGVIPEYPNIPNPSN